MEKKMSTGKNFHQIEEKLGRKLTGQEWFNIGRGYLELIKGKKGYYLQATTKGYNASLGELSDYE